MEYVRAIMCRCWRCVDRVASHCCFGAMASWCVYAPLSEKSTFFQSVFRSRRSGVAYFAKKRGARPRNARGRYKIEENLSFTSDKLISRSQLLKIDLVFVFVRASQITSDSLSSTISSHGARRTLEGDRPDSV